MKHMSLIAFQLGDHIFIFVFVVADNALFIGVGLVDCIESVLLKTSQYIDRLQLVISFLNSSLDEDINNDAKYDNKENNF